LTVNALLLPPGLRAPRRGASPRRGRGVPRRAARR